MMELTTGALTMTGHQRHHPQLSMLTLSDHQDPRERKEDGDHKEDGGMAQFIIVVDGDGADKAVDMAVAMVEVMVEVMAMVMEVIMEVVTEVDLEDMVEVTEEVTEVVMEEVMDMERKEKVTEVGEDGVDGLNISIIQNKSSTIIHQ